MKSSELASLAVSLKTSAGTKNKGFLGNILVKAKEAVHLNYGGVWHLFLFNNGRTSLSGRDAQSVNEKKSPESFWALCQYSH